MRVLLLSAYDAGSHRHWRENLCAGIGDWQWRVLTLPPRHFSWRIRGNPLSWSVTERETLEQAYDLLLATSMVDLATLRGLVPGLSQVPAALYFHENQFAYPDNRGRHGPLEAQMVTLYSALSAQRLLFNSRYNQDTFLSGVGRLLDSLPDAVPPGVVETLRVRSRVLPVPLDCVDAPVRAGQRGPLEILWNHRWEYDKGPERLLEIVRGLLDADLEFTLHVVGQQFTEQPGAFAEIRPLLEDAAALGSWGYVQDQQRYADLLQGCDVALSTALHDFQGLALMQACAAGCTPVAPDRLVYPEWLEERFLYPGDEDPAREAAAAVARIVSLAGSKARGDSLPRAGVSRFGAAVLMPRYRELLSTVAQAPG